MMISFIYVYTICFPYCRSAQGMSIESIVNGSCLFYNKLKWICCTIVKPLVWIFGPIEPER